VETINTTAYLDVIDKGVVDVSSVRKKEAATRA